MHNLKSFASCIGVFLYIIMYVVMVSNKVRLNLPEQLGCNRCPYMIARSTDSRNITGNNLSFDKILAF